MRNYSCSLCLSLGGGGVECLAIHLSQRGLQRLLGQFAASYTIKLNNVSLTKKREVRIMFHRSLLGVDIFPSLYVFCLSGLCICFTLFSQVCLKDYSNCHIENFLCDVLSEEQSVLYFLLCYQQNIALFILKILFSSPAKNIKTLDLYTMGIPGSSIEYYNLKTVSNFSCATKKLSQRVTAF